MSPNSTKHHGMSQMQIYFKEKSVIALGKSLSYECISGWKTGVRGKTSLLHVSFVSGLGRFTAAVRLAPNKR